MKRPYKKKRKPAMRTIYKSAILNNRVAVTMPFTRGPMVQYNTLPQYDLHSQIYDAVRRLVPPSTINQPATTTTTSRGTNTGPHPSFASTGTNPEPPPVRSSTGTNTTAPSSRSTGTNTAAAPSAPRVRRQPARMVELWPDQFAHKDKKRRLA